MYYPDEPRWIQPQLGAPDELAHLEYHVQMLRGAVMAGAPLADAILETQHYLLPAAFELALQLAFG